MLSIRIIYALAYFHYVVYFWGLRHQTSTGAPSLDPAGDFRFQTPNLPTRRKNPKGAYGLKETTKPMRLHWRYVQWF